MGWVSEVELWRSLNELGWQPVRVGMLDRCTLIGKPVCGRGVCEGGGGHAVYYVHIHKRKMGPVSNPLLLVTQGGTLLSLVPLVWELNPKLQGG